jgi:hypothetical protein
MLLGKQFGSKQHYQATMFSRLPVYGKGGEVKIMRYIKVTQSKGNQMGKHERNF